MSYQSKSFLAALLGGCAILAAAAERSVEAKDAGIHFASPMIRDGGCFLAPAVLEGKSAVRIDYNAFETRWLEFAIRRITFKEELPEITVEADFFLPAAGEIAAISLRVCDRDNETWQMKQPLPEQASGWITLRYQFRLGEGMKGGSWGPKEKKNGKFDWPISLSGFACSYRQTERLGFIGVGQIRVITP